MPKYMIERQMPGVGKMPAAEMAEGARKSNDVLQQMNGQVQWRESFVTDDKIYCLYIAPSEELVRRHAELSGFPADRISEVRMIIDPATAELKDVQKAA